MPAQRLGSAVDGREGRPQLMGGSGDELRLQLVEPPGLGQVSEGVDRSTEEIDAGDRDPALSAVCFERKNALCVARIRRGRRGYTVDQRVPPRDRVGCRAADDGVASPAGDRLSGGGSEAGGAPPGEEGNARGGGR